MWGLDMSFFFLLNLKYYIAIILNDTYLSLIFLHKHSNTDK